MRDLARELGVSAVTVSNALNKRGSMSQETRQRILDAAMARGYRRDEYASLSSRKRRNVPSRHLVAFDARNLVEGDNSDFGLFRTIYFQMVRVLSQHHCDVVLTDSSDPTCKADLARASAVIHVDGIPTGAGEALLNSAADRVNVALFFEHPRCISIMPDNEQAGRLAAQFLFDRGHRHVAVHGSTRTFDQKMRLEAFVRHFTALVPGASIKNAWVGSEDDPLEESGFEACFGSSVRRPTALFTVAGFAVLLANKYFHKKGLAVPGDVSLLGFDNFPFFDLLPVPLTRFHFVASAVGASVADAIVTGLSRKRFSPLKILVPIEFKAGDSVLPVSEMNHELT